MYLTFEEYKEMGGTLDETTFNTLEFDSESYVDYLTFSRLKKFTSIPLEVKRCVFSLIPKLQTLQSAEADNQTQQASISSQSNDGVSISYNVMNARDLVDNTKKEINALIKRYLDDTRDSEGKRILYRGL